MKKTFLALMIASVVLTGCGKSDEEIRQEQAAQAAQLELIAAQNAKQQQEADDAELSGVIAELKKGDPLIKDAYYGYNEKGDRVLHVVRDNPPQPVQQPQYQQGANGQPVIINNQPAQQASSGVSESIWPLAAGVGAGMLLANAMNSGGGYNSYQQSHRPYSNSYYSDNDYRRERTKVVNNYHTTVIQQTRQTVRANPKYQEQARLNAVQRPAVKANTQSFGTAQPVQARPVVKQASSGWGSSSTTATKPAAVKPSTSSWGSSSSSSSSRSSYTPSRSSSSSSSSSSRSSSRR